MKTTNLHRAYVLLLVATLIWCVLIILAPLLAHAHHYLGAGVIYLFFSKLCHQYPERAFICVGEPFAVCARCTGIYAGFFLGALFYPLFSRRATGTRIVLILFSVVLFTTLVDVLGNFFHLWQNNVWSRAFLGGGIGILLACIIIPGILSIIKAKGELNGQKTG